MKLQEQTPKGLHSVFETLRTILHSGKIASRVQYMIEVLFAIRKDRFQVRHGGGGCTRFWTFQCWGVPIQAHPAVLKELDLVNEDDQITHLLSLAEEDYDPEDMLSECINVCTLELNYCPSPCCLQMCSDPTRTTWRTKRSTS